MNGFSVTSVELLIAVCVASFLGSLHCVGMCGPFALMATGATSNKSQLLARLFLYHFGRLSTYIIAGVLVGLLGTLITSGGQLLGLQSSAARLAGALMILFGIIKLVHYSGRGKTNFHHLHGLSQKISQWLASLRPALGKMSKSLRAYASGGLTTLLPCGWLYIFLLVAGGTGSVLSSVMLMAAFWVGTIPALSGVVMGAQHLAPRFRKLLPIIGGLSLVLVGAYTALGRASADFSSLSKASQQFTQQSNESQMNSQLVSNREPSSSSLEQLAALKKEPLPCCQLRETPKAQAE